MIFFILMNLMFDTVVIMLGDIRHLSLLGVKCLKFEAKFQNTLLDAPNTQQKLINRLMSLNDW